MKQLRKKIFSFKTFYWFTQTFLVFAVGLSCYSYGKTGHLWGPTAIMMGFNIATLFYSECLRRLRKRNDELWSIIIEQQKTIRPLYELLDDKKQTAGFTRSPINPQRN